MSTLVVKADVAGRRAACAANPLSIPSTAERGVENFSAQFRSQKVERDGKVFFQLDGVASVVERWYPMFDMFGPYDELVAKGAFDNTLREDPDVNFLLNHRGMSMARTKGSKTLELATNDAGDLAMTALLNPERGDVRDLIVAIDDGDIDQMSFAFRIKRGAWNEDYTTYTIQEVDIDRGDVSAVNYGANPFTTIAARTHQVLEGIEHLQGANLRAAQAALQERLAAERSAAPTEPVAETGPVSDHGADLHALIDAGLV